jgi:hypothetical protein
MGQQRRAEQAGGEAEDREEHEGRGEHHEVQAPMHQLSRLRPDNFTLMIVGALILGSVLPVQDRAAEWLSLFANGPVPAWVRTAPGLQLSRNAIAWASFMQDAESRRGTTSP